jgi:two-component system, cell cycle sensor histidine kinase and response regulator CckA
MAKTAKRLQHEQLQLAIDAEAAAMVLVNGRGNIALVNSAAERLFEYTRRELIGRSIDTLVPGSWPQQHTGLQRLWATLSRRELHVRRKDSYELPVEVVMHPLKTREGLRTLYSIVDISERKRAEAALRESEARFRNLADTAPVMIWSSGQDKGCTFFNRVWLDFRGRTLEEELGEGWTEGVHADDLAGCMDTYVASFDARKRFQMEYRLRRHDGEYRWVLDSGVPLWAPDGAFAGYVGSCLDITESRRALQQAFSHQKLESLGVATAGIAHDFGNLLSGIIAHAELLLEEFPPDSPNARDVRIIIEIAARGSEIVKELMVYTGRDGSALEPLDVSVVAEEMMELLKVSISKHTILKTEFSRRVPMVLASPTHIRQIVMNLILNASEAIGDGSGVIELTTSQATVSEGEESNTSSNVIRGQYARLAVSDTGAGIAPEVQPRIFDPFFTTKPEGRGLGLAVTQAIVRRYGGRIEVHSVVGQGTRFEVLLPGTGLLVSQSRSARSGT